MGSNPRFSVKCLLHMGYCTWDTCTELLDAFQIAIDMLNRNPTAFQLKSKLSSETPSLKAPLQRA